MKNAWLFAVPLSLAITSGAWASDPQELAKRHYRSGIAHFEASRWADARAAFSAGYELSRRPAFFLNMAECERKLGHEEEAAALYRRYLADDPNGTQRATAEAKLKELAPPTPPPAVLPAVERARSESAPIARVPIRPALPPAPAETESRSVWISVVLGGVGGTGIAAGVALELAALFTANDLAAQSCTGGASSCSAEIVANTERHNVFVGTGAAALGVGGVSAGALITYLAWPEDAEAVSGVAVLPWVSEERIGGTVGVSF